MDECRKQFEEYCKKINVRPHGDYGQDVYEFWQAAWNRRAQSDRDAVIEECAKACEKEAERQTGNILKPGWGYADAIRALKKGERK